MKSAHSVSGFLLLTAISAQAMPDLSAQPAPFPVFLRVGFSSVLEFDEIPTRVVLGDGQAFQVERLDHSLVLRTMVPYATSNMFVYFKEATPKLFVLTAAEDAQPTFFKRIENPKPIPTETPAATGGQHAKASHVLSTRFDAKKDYLTLDVILSADSRAILRPRWDLVRLRYLSRIQAPFKLWSERKEVQKDATVRARFIFLKPNVPRNLSSAVLVVPIDGETMPLILPLGRASR
jgi:hypothetical protein